MGDLPGSEKIDEYNIVQCLYDLPPNRVHERCKVIHYGADTEASAQALRRELNAQRRWGGAGAADVKRADLRRLFYLLALGIKNCNLEESMATRDVFRPVPMHTKCCYDLQLFLALCVYMAMGHSHNLPTRKCESINALATARGDVSRGDAIMDWFFGHSNSTCIRGNVESRYGEVVIHRKDIEGLNIYKALDNKKTIIGISGTYSYRGLAMHDNNGASLTKDMVAGMHFPMLLLFTCVVPSMKEKCNSTKRHITEEERIMLRCCPLLYKEAGSDMLQIHFVDKNKNNNDNNQTGPSTPPQTPGDVRKTRRPPWQSPMAILPFSEKHWLATRYGNIFMRELSGEELYIALVKRCKRNEGLYDRDYEAFEKVMDKYYDHSRMENLGVSLTLFDFALFGDSINY